MVWVLVGAAWLALAVLVALLIGRSIRIADDSVADIQPNFVVDPDAPSTHPQAAAAAAPPRARPEGESPTVPGIPVARPSAVHHRRRTWPSTANRRSKSA